MPGVVAWAPRALAIGDAEQAASRSKPANPLESIKALQDQLSAYFSTRSVENARQASFGPVLSV